MIRRRRLFTGIYEDRSGIAIVVSINGRPREFRKDAKGIPYAQYERHTLIAERARIDARERLKAERRTVHAERFDAAVDTFLGTLSAGHRRNTHGYMAHWLRAFTGQSPNAITDLEVQTAFASMPQSNSTKMHIRRALIQFYATLNGPSGYNPARSLRKPPKDEAAVRDLPWTDIEKLFNALPASKTKARLLLIAYVGLPQKQIAQLRPSDLRLKDRELVVHPRRKGAGAAGRVMPLSDVAIAALKEFIAQDAFGTFQNRQIVETFWSGAKKAKITLPDNARPYDLRHSFLTELARGGADIHDIAHLGMHATLQQAARYIKGAASARATKMIASVPRFTNVATLQTDTKRATTLHQTGTKTARKRRGKNRESS